MKSPEPSLAKQLQSPEVPGVDLVVIMRGGATALLTTLLKLTKLQDQLPFHLTDYRPYYLGDSAGAYALYGLAVPSKENPSRPSLTPWEILGDFLAKAPEYLNPDREVARAALKSHGGNTRIMDALTPVCFSTVNITGRMHRDYFRYFPESYMADHPNFEAPANSHETVAMDDAVLASSAFPVYLRDHQISSDDGMSKGEVLRAIDMAFTEGHSSNLTTYALKHREAFPSSSGRRVVCLVFGNNFLDLRISPDKPLPASGVQRHMADIVRSLSHADLVDHCRTMFGDDNVFDLSLMVPQDISQRVRTKLPLAFRSDPAALVRRYQWTQEMLALDPEGDREIMRAAEVIRSFCQPIPNAPPLTRTGHEQEDIETRLHALTQQVPANKVARMGHDFTTVVKPIAHHAFEPVVTAVTPAVITMAHTARSAYASIRPGLTALGAFVRAHCNSRDLAARAFDCAVYGPPGFMGRNAALELLENQEPTPPSPIR